MSAIDELGKTIACFSAGLLINSTLCGKFERLNVFLKKMFDLNGANHYYAPRCQRGDSQTTNVGD